jgi:hypothetical protein
MPNKFFFITVILSCIGVPVFSQAVATGQSEANEFIESFYWYQKYLPLDNVPVYYVMRETLVYLKANDTEEFDRIGNDMGNQIRDLKKMVFESLQREIEQKDIKMVVLYRDYGSTTNVRELNTQYRTFKAAITAGHYPQDDASLDRIEELYSFYVTRSGYFNPNWQDYVVRQGDYFRKIAKKFYRDEMQWRRIYNFRNNKSLLPNPDNPDLILPGIRLQIPPPFPPPLQER